MRRVGLSAVFAAIILCLGIVTAWAHGDVMKTDPKKNASVELPEVVSVTLSEAPVPQSKLAIMDGCGRDVSDGVAVHGEVLQASIGDAQPGEWTATFSAVSAVDGHHSEGDWSFTVEGTADCDGDAEEIAPTNDPSHEPTESSDDDTSNAAGDDSTTNTSDPEESSFPVVPVVIGGVALVAVAAAVRAKSAG